VALNRVCVIYGSLPPQTRRDQAQRFNDPASGYDVLVASDAIGMGLNLNIRRIIFNSIFKYNGESVTRLDHSAVKQIAGRAGRRNSPYPDGEVTCRDPRDLVYIRECLSTDIKPIEKAALLPTDEHVEEFSEALKDYDGGKVINDLHETLRQFSAMATVKGDYFLGRQTEMRMVARHLKDIPLSIRDAYTMCLSPIASRGSLDIVESFARKYASGEISGLPIPDQRTLERAKSFDDLGYLCSLYADSDLFLWLQLRFPPGDENETKEVLERKEKALEYINLALSDSESLELNHDYVQQSIDLRRRWAGGGRGRSRNDNYRDSNGKLSNAMFFDDRTGRYVTREEYFLGDEYADDEDKVVAY
jgi:ATP-dependent RNA helicase SUPV3L1/SUV3